MSLDDQESGLTPEEYAPDLMSPRERACLVGLGVLAGGAGGYAVFASSNQAGTVVLLLISATFLLVGIQGTPLVKFTSSSAGVELARRRRVDRALRRAEQEKNPAKAAGIVEGVSIAEPNLVPRSYATGLLFERHLAVALMDLGYSLVEHAHDIGYDLAVEKAGKRVAVEVKYSRDLIPTAMIDREIQAAERIAMPILIVANQRLTTEAAKTLAGNSGLRFALWRDEHDNDNLKAALIGLGIYSS